MEYFLPVWPWNLMDDSGKIIRHVFYTTSSFVYNFRSISEFNWSYSPKTPNLGQIQWFLQPCDLAIWRMTLKNKANLRDLIPAAGLEVLPQSDSNNRFFSLCDLEIWWMTPKNNRTPLRCYFKLFASFRSHWWIQTGVTIWKRPIWVQIDDFLAV